MLEKERVFLWDVTIEDDPTALAYALTLAYVSIGIQEAPQMRPNLKARDEKVRCLLYQLNLILNPSPLVAVLSSHFVSYCARSSRSQFQPQPLLGLSWLCPLPLCPLCPLGLFRDLLYQLNLNLNLGFF